MRYRLLRGRRVLAEGFDLAALQAEQRRRTAAKAATTAGNADGAAAGSQGAGRPGAGKAGAGKPGAEKAGAGKPGAEKADAETAGAGASGGGGTPATGSAGAGRARRGGTAAEAAVPTREQLIDRVVAQAGRVLAYVKEHLTTQEKLILAGHQTTADALLDALLRVAARGELAGRGIGADGRYAAGANGTGPDGAGPDGAGPDGAGGRGAATASGQGASGEGVPELDALVRAAQGGLAQRVDQLLPALVSALTAFMALDKVVTASSSLVILSNLADVKEWREQMGAPAAIAGLSEAALLRLPRWVEAAGARVDAMVDQPPRDRQLMDRVRTAEAGVEKKLLSARPEVAGLGRAARLGAVVAPGAPPRGPGEGWHAVLFQQEELRISLYAPALGTVGKVSEQRIAKALAAL
jgi:ATP-dependent helicase HrpA